MILLLMMCVVRCMRMMVRMMVRVTGIILFVFMMRLMTEATVLGGLVVVVVILWNFSILSVRLLCLLCLQPKVCRLGA